MDSIRFYAPNPGRALEFACGYLVEKGAVPTSKEVCTHLLLDCPCRLSDRELETLAEGLPNTVTVAGGFLDRAPLRGFSKLDFLKQEDYLGKNADITAQCALLLAVPRLETVWSDTKVCIVGFGRIGKRLSRYLLGLHAAVTVCARSEHARREAIALGCHAMPLDMPDFSAFDLVYNTVPALVGTVEGFSPIAFDLASQPGLLGEAVIPAKGLPGKMAPKSAGKLLADSIFKEVNP